MVNLLCVVGTSQFDELEGELEVLHVEVGCGEAYESIDPPRHQLEPVQEPQLGVPKLVQFLIRVSEVVDQNQVRRILAKTLLVVVHSCIDLPIPCLQDTFLEPELDAIHVLNF